MALVAAPTIVTGAGLKARLGAVSWDEGDAAVTLATATELVLDVFAQAWRDVPVAIVDEVLLRTSRALKDAAKSASSGSAQVTAGEAQPLRAPADPLVSSYPIIRRYVVLGI